jgi:hypothetical protein
MYALRTLRAPLARATLRATPVARFSALSVRLGGEWIGTPLVLPSFFIFL